MLASDVMTGAAITIAPDATVADAARIMAEKGLSGLPVVGLSGQLVGCSAMTRALLASLPKHTGALCVR